MSFIINPYSFGAASPYTNVKVWPTDKLWIYSLAPGTPFPSSGPTPASFTVTGDVGWTPGTYTITQVVYNFSTSDGPQNMLRLSSSPTGNLSISGGQGILNM